MRKEKLIEADTRKRFDMPDDQSVDWKDVGPRAVLSLIAVLYEKKLNQGKDEIEADREADEDACEMTGLTISQLGDLYDEAGLDSIRCLK